MSDGTRNPSYAALRRHEKRVQSMYDDPDCTEDLLLLGLALARYVDFELMPNRAMARKLTYSELGQMVFKVKLPRQLLYRVEGVLRSDVRRYAIQDAQYAATCPAPMIRREGACGSAARHRAYLVDIGTGERSPLYACNRHKDWAEVMVKRNRAAIAVTPPPIPVANSGGVLARHIPEINWEKAYLAVDPRWTPPPEDAPWRKPRFELVLGDLEPDTDETERPTLSVVPGAGERIRID
jgi:hypothetical protein